MEGALANLQPCVMAIARPRQPRTRFITPTMQYSAREYSAPAPVAANDFFATRDMVTAIGPDAALAANLPVPPALFMPMSQPSVPMPKRYALRCAGAREVWFVRPSDTLHQRPATLHSHYYACRLESFTAAAGAASGGLATCPVSASPTIRYGAGWESKCLGGCFRGADMGSREIAHTARNRV